MFGLKKKPDVEPVDFTAPLARALNNPIAAKRSGDPKDRVSPDLRATLSAIEATFYVIDQIRDVLSEAAQLVLRAKDVEELGGRALLAEQYDELRNSISQILAQADDDARKLLAPGARPLTASLKGQSKYTVDPENLDINETGLDLPPPLEAFSTTSEIADILGHLEKALAKVDHTSSYYMKDARFLISRLEK